MAFKLDKLLEAFGVTGNTGAEDGEVHIQLGPGVIGLTSVVVIVAFVAIAACAVTLAAHAAVLFGIVGIIGLLLLIFLLGTWIFAHFHKDLALLGGSELPQYHRMQMAALHPEIMADKTLTIAPPPTADRPDEPGAA